MSEKDTKVLGYVAIIAGTQSILCIGESCIVAASEEKMKEYIRKDPNSNKLKFEFSKARFGHVRLAMSLGGAYAFDKDSYIRFYALGILEGLNLNPFPNVQNLKPNPKTQTFMMIQLIDGFLISQVACNNRNAKVR